MGGFKNFSQQWSLLWKRLGPMGRVAVTGGAAVLLIAVVGVSFWVTTTKSAVLFSGLSPEDAAAIGQKLDADRVTYELSANGTTILVPEDRVLKVRMNLAVAGLPQGAGKGYELFDQMSLGASPFQQNLNYIRAVQGELARTIMQLEPVAHARVHIVQPDPTPFIRDKEAVTASVVIRTKPNQSLTRRTTAGIVALVAGSVKGLTQDNVTIVDSDGLELSERRDAKSGLASSDQLEYQRDVEGNLATKAQEILSRLLGPGRAVVRVTAEMSFRRVKEQSEKVDPEGRAVTRESITSSKTTTPAATKGPAGAVANVPPGQNAGPANNGSTKQDETTESEYAVSRDNSHTEENQAKIDRLTVAVILVPPTGSDDADPEEALGITAEEARELVKQAVGYKDGRDQIQVSVGRAAEGPMDIAIDQQIVANQQWDNYIKLVKASALVIAILAGGTMLVMLFRSKPANDQSNTVEARSPIDSLLPEELADVGAITQTLKTWLSESGRQSPPVTTAS